MKKTYKEYIKLNKNIILGFIAALTISTITAQLLAEQKDYVNSSYTVVVDFITFYSTFTVLFYFDNKAKYRLETGQVNYSRLKKDIVKIISSLGAGELVYIASRWSLQYYFLTINYEAYLASIIAHLVSTLIYMVVVNLGVKIMRLYKDEP
ncbi:MAG TPA: hypothetical protein VFM64_03045 [Candidatus Nitrosotenuis sp.]|nr:hypothetical protein [Candidatus Nitrosotenuis sp.]